MHKTELPDTVQVSTRSWQHIDNLRSVALCPFSIIGDGRILKVEGHSSGSNYFGAKRRKKIFGAPHFSVVPTQFFDGIRGTTI